MGDEVQDTAVAEREAEQAAVPRADADDDHRHGQPNADREGAVQVSSPAELPVLSLRSALPYLRQPFTVEAVKWKVQATWPKQNPTAGLVVPYIDARLVDDRLNMVIGPNWSPRYEPFGQRHMWCHLTVDGVTRCDVGEGQGKALVSDARKRAARLFGIGVSLNAIPKVIFKLEDGHLRKPKGGDALLLTDEGEARCREIYAEWLQGPGGQFGEPLDHGDALGSVGAPEEDEHAVESEPSLPVEGEEADALRDEVKQAFDRLRGVDGEAMLPAEYERLRREAEVSVEGLRELRDDLVSRLAEADAKAGVAA